MMAALPDITRGILIPRIRVKQLPHGRVTSGQCVEEYQAPSGSVNHGGALICEEAPTGRPNTAQAKRPGLTDCFPCRILKGRSTDPAVPPHRSR
jgi:hypothetical protein